MKSPRLEWSSDFAQRLCEAELAAEWDDLNARGCNLPFLSSSAVFAALQSFGTGKERLLVAREGRRAIGMMVIAPAGALRWSTFQPSQIPLGLWVATRGHSLDSLARGALGGPLGRSLSLSVKQVDPLFFARPPDSASVESSDYISTAWIDLAGTFEDYWNGRGKNLKRNLRRARERLAAEAAKLRVEVITDAAEMRAAIQRYGHLEARGWKAAAGTAVSSGNRQGEFYADFLEGAARSGESATWELWFGDRLAASNLCVQCNGVLTILKTAYDEALAEYSPAFLLSEELLRRSFAERRLQRIEYYGRVMEWHRRWTSLERVLYHITVYRWPLIKRVAQQRRRLAGLAAVPPAAEAAS